MVCHYFDIPVTYVTGSLSTHLYCMSHIVLYILYGLSVVLAEANVSALVKALERVQKLRYKD